MKILLSKKVEKQFDKIPDRIFEHILVKIKELADQTGGLNIRKLTNREGYRLRVGDYRVLYKCSKTELTILSVAHRKDAYRV